MKLKTEIRLFVIFLLMAGTVQVAAETVYINDNLTVGLHQENNIDTPIIKIIPSSTPLELLKQENPLSQVKDADGNIGWVDNKYLTHDIPLRLQLEQANQKIHLLMQQNQTTDNPVTGATPLSDSHDQTDANVMTAERQKMQNELNAEKIHVGELQAQITELRKQLAESVSANEDTEPAGNVLPEKKPDDWLSYLKSHKKNKKKFFIIIITSLALGFFAGLYLLDRYNRKRHGGFRI